MNNQILQKNNLQPKTVNFQGSSPLTLNEFKSLIDLNELLKNFKARDSNLDTMILKKIGSIQF